jgi:Lon protease-like protein
VDDLGIRDFDGRCRLFPLPGVVLFPHSVLPLHVFEPRYRQMTEHALASDKLIAIVQVRRDADWSGESEPELESVACLGKILKHERLPDGRYNILLQGRKRVRIVREVPTEALYRVADVEVLEDVAPPVGERTWRADLIEVYRVVARRTDSSQEELESLLSEPPPLGVVTDLLAQAFGLPPSLKQALLDEVRIERRALALLSILRQVVAQLDAEIGVTRPNQPPFSDN